MDKYLKKQLYSFKYAFRGIIIILKDYNSLIHTPATIIVLGSGYYFNITTQEWLWVLLAITLVWASEIINTAIEKLVDLVSPKYHELAKQVKDLTAGAVLVCSTFAVVVGIIVFWKYL